MAVRSTQEGRSIPHGSHRGDRIDGRRAPVRIAALVALFVVLPTGRAVAQTCTDPFDPSLVLDYHITMDPADWESLAVSCPGGFCGPSPHTYFQASFRCGDATPIVVGVRRKNGLAEPSEADPQKPALKIDVNEFVPGQTWMGKTKLSLENGAEGALITEGLTWLLYGDAGIVGARAAWANVWVNGELKGLYVLVEQIDKRFLSDRGIDDGGWLFKVEQQRTREGQPNPYAFTWYPFDHAAGDEEPEPTPPDWQDQAIARVEMGQLLTLGVVENFVANTDGAFGKGTNYWYYDWAVFPEGQQPRLYFAWDLDTSLRNNRVGWPVLGAGRGHLRKGLVVEDPSFQASYLSIYAGLMEGPLSLPATLARLDGVEAAVAASLAADPFTNVDTGELQRIRDFLQARTTSVLNQLGLCPDAVCDPAEDPCTCPNDCGAAPATETDCTDGLDQDCDAAVDCADSDCDGHASCIAAPSENRVLVTEILANSPGSPDVEFVELLNAGPGAQDLTGWFLLDDDDLHDRAYLEGILGRGERLVVAGRRDLFVVAYPEVTNLNPTGFDGDAAGVGFGLGNGGDRVRLFRTAAQGDVLADEVTFGPQGAGIPFGLRPEDADAPEHLSFPTPGVANDASAPHSPVCINEFLTTSQAGGVDDWIELYNRGGTAVDIGGWYLSDDVFVPFKYAFPPGTVLGPGEYLSVDETELGFALSSTGSEAIVLTHADGATGQDYLDYGPQFPDVTRGRFPDGAPHWHFFTAPTRDLPNVCAMPPLGEVSGLGFAGRGDFDWTLALDAEAYDVVRGELGALRASGGDFLAGATTCLRNNVEQTASWDDDAPSGANGFFYLVRATDHACGFGGYGSTGAGEVPGRDVVASVCP